MKRMSWYHLNALIILAFIATLGDASNTAPQGYYYQSADVSFPDELAGVKLYKVTNYEQQGPGLGVGVTYKTNHLSFDIYFYQNNQNKISENIDDPLIVQQFQQAIADIHTLEKMGYYRDVNELSRVKTPFGDREVQAAKLSYRYEGAEKISYVFLFSYANHFCKIRFTYDKSSDIEAEKTLADLKQQFSALLKVQTKSTLRE